MWRKRVKDGPLVGIKAKTHYPPRPDDWADDCLADMAARGYIESGKTRSNTLLLRG